MDFKGFYDEIIFDVDRPILKSYTGKQGDTKSRGLYVTVTQKNAAIEDLTGLSMRFFYEKPDKTRGFIDGVVDGNKFRIDYTNQMYAVPGVVKAELRLMGVDDEIITAKTFKILVDSSIADGSIVSENERGILDRAFELAEDIIPRLELLDVELLEDVQDEMLGARYSGTKDETYDSLGQRLDASEQDLLNHKAEYTSNRQQDQLKIAKVEKELNDYKATMQQVNINQEPKQKVSGYGMVSLPKNAANGQVSVSLKGLTATNLVKNGNFSNGTAGWLTVENGFAWSVLNNEAIITNLGTVTNSYKLYQFIPVISGDKYYMSVQMSSNSNTIGIGSSGVSGFASKYHSGSGLYENLSLLTTATETGMGSFRFLYTTSVGDITANPIKLKNAMLMNLTLIFGAGNEPTVEECDQIFANWFDGTKSTNSASRLKSVSEDESEVSTAYVTAKDEEGNIVELRSLPNGTKDEFRVSEGKLIQRIGHKENVASGTVINYADMADGGQFVAYYADGMQQIGVKGDTLTADAVQLNYQLAEPVEIPVQVSGTLLSYPSGTVYIENVVADAGLYSDGITVLNQDLPIKSIEKISKIDYETGLETILDASKAVIASDKLSFTHPDLSEGDIVFFEYEYDVESTEGETEVEYYDSRYVIKDSVTDKFYKWNIVVANGQPSIELVEV